MSTEYDYGWTREELAKEARRAAGEDSDSSGPATDETTNPQQLKDIYDATAKALLRFQSENNDLKNRIVKLEKTVSVLEAIRKQNEKNRLEEMVRGSEKLDNKRIIEYLKILVQNQHLSENGCALISFPPDES